MTEKDEFGDKLRDKQRAEEDRYFAQQERAKLEKLRAQTAINQPALGLCPRDGAALAKRDHLGTRVDECPTCGGVWLDGADLERIERKDEGWAQRWLRGLSGARR
jgi:Zn-finger nucleic acid-binding protein